MNAEMTLVVPRSWDGWIQWLWTAAVMLETSSRPRAQTYAWRAIDQAYRHDPDSTDEALASLPASCPVCGHRPRVRHAVGGVEVSCCVGLVAGTHLWATAEDWDVLVGEHLAERDIGAYDPADDPDLERKLRLEPR